MDLSTQISSTYLKDIIMYQLTKEKKSALYLSSMYPYQNIFYYDKDRTSIFKQIFLLYNTFIIFCTTITYGRHNSRCVYMTL